MNLLNTEISPTNERCETEGDKFQKYEIATSKFWVPNAHGHWLFSSRAAYSANKADIVRNKAGLQLPIDEAQSLC